MAYSPIIGGGQLQTVAAEHWNELEEAYKQAWGSYLGVTSALRTYAEQQRLYDGWIKRLPGFSLAARPGHSLHEKGLSVDVAAPANVDGHPQHEWLEANAGRFGFKWTGKNFRPVEPWHFDYIGGGQESPAFSQIVANRQEYLNETFQAGLVVDGYDGPKTQAATKSYQTILGVDPDGKWGPKTEAAHQSYVAQHSHKPGAPVGNPFNLEDVRGLQKIAKLYGGRTDLDNAWGSESAKGFANFLRRNYGYVGNDILGPNMWRAIASWLRARWGYVGNDVYGPVMKAALTRANAANYAEL